jgi:hypothetical protein
MVPKRFLREVRDLLSYSGIAFLIAYGFQTAFSYPGWMLVRQHRWFGYWIIASAFAIAARMNEASRAAVSKAEQA